MKRGLTVKTIVKYLIAAGLMALFAFFVFGRGLFESGDDLDATPEPPVTSPEPKKNAVELQLTRMVSRKNREKFWELDASRIVMNQDNKKGDAQELKCTFFDAQGKPYISLNAPAADIDLNTQSLYFKGRVKAQMADGDTMEVARLVWDGKKKRLFGYDSVRMTKGTALLKGRRLIGDPARKYVEIIGHVDVIWLDRVGRKASED